MHVMSFAPQNNCICNNGDYFPVSALLSFIIFLFWVLPPTSSINTEHTMHLHYDLQRHEYQKIALHDAYCEAFWNLTKMESLLSPFEFRGSALGLSAFAGEGVSAGEERESRSPR